MNFLPPLDLTPEIMIKLVLASVLGGVVGLERELRGKPAGLRTNILICAGSALFTILSEVLGTRLEGDATRITSQLIPGIGFIGAGSIIRARGSVKGLTSAATIFVLASIGMAVGGGLYWTAVFSAVSMLLALSLLGWIERRLEIKKQVRHYRVCGPELASLSRAVMEIVRQGGLTPSRLSSRRRDGLFEVAFDLDSSPEQHNQLVERLTERNLTCEFSMVEGEESE